MIKYLKLFLVFTFLLSNFIPANKIFALDKIDETNATDQRQEADYAPEDAKIISVELEYYKGTTDAPVPNYLVKVYLNKEVSPRALVIFNNSFELEEVPRIKKGLLYDKALGRGMEVWLGNQPSEVFTFSLTPIVASQEKPDVIGEILLIGLHTLRGLRLNNFYLLSEGGKYEELPVPSLNKVFGGYLYLYYSSACEFQNYLCSIFEKYLLGKPLFFESSFAQKYPLIYVLSLFSLFILGVIVFGLLVLSYLLTLILQRKPWGVAFDAKTLQPIEGAIVRIFDKEKNKLLETKVTGKDGRFTFLPGRGDYYLRVIKPGYQFPSKILTRFHHPAYYHLYHGEEFLIRSDSTMFITNIPLDPEHKPSLIIRPMIFQRIFYALARARWPLVIIFLILTVLNLLVYYLWKIEFIPIKWLAIGIAPIFLLELYFWWQGRRVRILEKEMTPEQRKAFALAPTEAEPVKEIKIPKKPLNKTLMIISIIVLLALGIILGSQGGKIINFAQNLISGQERGGEKAPEPEGDIAGSSDIKNIPRYPESTIFEYQHPDSLTFYISYEVKVNPDQIKNYFFDLLTKDGWGLKEEKERIFVFEKEPSLCEIEINSSDEGMVVYKISYWQKGKPKEASSIQAKPGLTPGNPLSVFDTLGEKISLLFTFGTEKRVKKLLAYSEEKLAEAKMMAEKSKGKPINKALSKHQEYLGRAFDELKDTTTSQSQELLVLIAETNLRHQEGVLEIDQMVSSKDKEMVKSALTDLREENEEVLGLIAEGSKKEELKAKVKELENPRE